MKLQKANNRDRKHKKRRHGMRVDGRSVLDIEREIRKRADKIRTEEAKQNGVDKEDSADT